jgi:hypothetical protein
MSIIVDFGVKPEGLTCCQDHGPSLACLRKPEGLDETGERAYEVVAAFLKARGMAYTGGCRVFYSPKEWCERGEQYGKKAALIVAHDGGEHARAFSFDACHVYGRAEEYEPWESMQDALGEVGCFAEQCTCWYTAIYSL